MSISANFPNVRPSLLLDFANSQQLDPRVTFSRSTTAPYYDGKTSVLAEQNLFLQSQTFTSASWNKLTGGAGSAPTITGAYATAPDGTTTASRAQFSLGGGTTTSDLSQLAQDVSTVNGLPYTMGIWVKSTDGVSSYAMQLGGSGVGSAITVTGTWTQVTQTSTGIGSAVSFQIRLRGGQTPTNANTADILVWGAQVEQRSSVTAYNATTTSAITNYIPQLLTAPINSPRFDFNPTTGESLGLLIEQSSTNLLTYSQDFSNASWNKLNATITNASNIAPDGTQTMQTLVEDTSTGLHRVFNLNAFVTSTSSPTTYSVYAKSAGRNIQVTDNDAVGAFFDLSSGTVTSGTGTITPVGNNVYRCTISRTNSTVNGRIAVYLVSTGTTTSYTGNGYSGVYIWGSQAEALAFATSYIPTTSAQVTRASDNASMTGTNFSSWYNYPNGTFYTEYARSATGIQNSSIFCVQYDINNYVNFYGSGGNDFLYAASQGVSSVLNQSFGTTSTSYKKFAISLAALNVIATYNATTPYTNSTYPQPNSFTALGIGQAIYSAGTTFNGRIRKLAYYPQAVTSTQLQALTGS